ncbi:hypothetical protein N7528_007028 [Penicillium herquei]|nr:hypothetical protein N7528_007028 [Penicillium herquei]
MADPNQQRVTTAFAPPPPLWKYFTRENLDKLEEIKKASTKEDERPKSDKRWTPEELRALEIPQELRFLVPPETPTSEYSVFGELQSLSTVLPSLKEQGIEQLYPEPTTDTQDPSKPQPLNHAYYLLKISKSLLLNFLEFVGILSVSPEQFEPKVEDMRNMFINAHHLLNLYRPHQARESLIMMMEEQLERTRNEIKQMDKVKADIQSALEELQSSDIRDSSTERPESENGQSEANPQKAENTQILWNLLDSDN